MSSDPNKKTIKVNPEIFNVGGRRNTTKKERKQKPSAPLINPNVLKNKLIQRIKEHKKNENGKEALERKGGGASGSESENKDIFRYSDEFHHSLDYLNKLHEKKKNDISNKKKQNENTNLFQIQTPTLSQEYRNNNIQRNVIVPNQPTTNSQNHLPVSVSFQPPPPPPLYSIHVPEVQLDLPESLTDDTYRGVGGSGLVDITNMQVPVVKYNIDSVVPYGCLKGGYKSTFKEWKNKTVRNKDFYGGGSGNNAPTVSLVETEREKRMRQLKEKIRKRQQELRQDHKESIVSGLGVNTPFEEPVVQAPQKLSVTFQLPEDNTKQEEPLLFDIPTKREMNNVIMDISEKKKEKEKETTEKSSGGSSSLIKRTIKRKYVLGRSKTSNKVGILIKDRQTRKRIMTEQKDMKKKSIPDIKQYLKEHGLLKSGSHAPNDVLRKMYEASILTGDVNNYNKDILMHNFFSEKEKDLDS
jgi:hypothetical protein